MCKWSICASCWKEKQHQRKLQRSGPPHVPVEYLHLLMEGKHHQRKVQRSGPASGQIGAGCSNSSCNDNHHTTDQIRTSTGAVGVPDAAINATCVRAHHITSTCPNACNHHHHIHLPPPHNHHHHIHLPPPHNHHHHIHPSPPHTTTTTTFTRHHHHIHPSPPHTTTTTTFTRHHHTQPPPPHNHHHNHPIHPPPLHTTTTTTTTQCK